MEVEEWQKKCGRPGLIRCVSGHEVDVRGEGPIFKYVQTKLEDEFLTGQYNNLTTLTSEVQNCGRALEQMIHCIIFVVGTHPPYVCLAST